jgi:xylulokinase
MKRHEPENFARIRHVALPHDYLNWYLTGNLVMEFGDASGTALLDVRKKQWCQPLVDFIDPGLMQALPTVGSSRTSVGRLRPELASRWGLKNSVAISMGGGDNMMGAIGTGNVEAGKVTASLGTSGTIYARANQPVIDPSGEIAAFCDSTDGWLPLLCTMNVTVATEAVRAMFGLDHAGLERAVSAAPPGADGLLFLPYLQGERTPNLPKGSGVLHGMTTSNMTPAHIARATMEGVTLGLAYGLQQLRTLGLTPTEIRLTGGGSKSAVWRQMCADIFGCPVTTLHHAEGAALGGAIQALALVSGKPLSELVEKYVQTNPAETHQPRKNFDYGALLAKHTALTQALAGKSFL